jgi:hypothetical protein
VTVQPGVAFAPSNTPFDASPTFARIDSLDGVHIGRIRIERGRADEWQKSAVGQVTISGEDTSGALDPTNETNSFWVSGATQLDPCKPLSVALYNPVLAAWTYLFYGYTADLTYDLDVSEKKLAFELTGEDMLGILRDSEIIPGQAGTNDGTDGTVTYVSQGFRDRILAVLADTATAFPKGMGGSTPIWPSSQYVVFSGNVVEQESKYSAKTSHLNVIDETCDAEFPSVAVRYVSRSGVFTALGRYARFHPADYSTYITHWYVGDLAAAASNGYIVVPTSMKFTRGKTNLVNCALCTPFGIAQADIPGQFVYDSTSVAKYGPRVSGMSLEQLRTQGAEPGSADAGNDALAETALFGQYIVDNYKNPVNRVSQLTFRNPPAGATSARKQATWNLLGGIELSDWITLTMTHPGGGGFTAVDFFVEEITYDLVPLSGDTWDVTLTVGLSPRSYFDNDPFGS